MAKTGKLRALFQLACLGLALANHSALATSVEETPPLLLISIDGFRWDYCELHPAETPRLRQLKQEGASARGLIPVFPSNTFANHYSIVTGLYPSHHGIINNYFYDPVLQAAFHYNQPELVQQSRWWGGEPVWVTAIKQGRKSACSFWVGSEAEIQGIRPAYWKVFDYKIPFAQRLDELAGWLSLPLDQRPAFASFYLEETNSVAHAFGPDSPELIATLKLIDDRIGAIVDRLRRENRPVNLVIVSDHGMTSSSPDRVVVLDDYLDVKTVQVDFDGPVTGLRPSAGQDDTVLKALARLPHAKVYRVEDLPRHLHVTANVRNPPIWIIADEGWHVDRRSTLASLHARKHGFIHGEHGYDPSLASMRGLLIAHGPAFKRGAVIETLVENVHLYNLMCAALHLAPAPNDGDDRLVRAFLR